MPVDVDGRVADAECFADVGFFFSGARRQLYGVRFVRQGDAGAVFASADAPTQKPVGYFGTMPTPNPAKCPTVNTVTSARTAATQVAKNA